MLKYILVIDFETSDLPANGGLPVEVGCVLLHKDTHKELAHFQQYMYLQPGESICREAYKCNGLTQEFLKQNGVSRNEGFSNFWYWLAKLGIEFPKSNAENPMQYTGQLIWMGQNVGFDQYMLKVWAGMFAEPMQNIFTRIPIDTMNIARFYNDAAIHAYGDVRKCIFYNDHGLPSASLECQMESIGEDTTGAHGALWDARACATMYRHHINNLADMLHKHREVEPNGLLCPSCGARLEKDYTCIICGKTWGIVECC